VAAASSAPKPFWNSAEVKASGLVLAPGSASVPLAKDMGRIRAKAATFSALAAASAGSGALPWAKAPMGPKFIFTAWNRPWRISKASSGFCWAAA